jgi:acetoin:2,6-dichlorophenolindophenol oxidoreductase subunit beta
MKPVTMRQAVCDAQREEMLRDKRVFVMGEDIRANMYGSSGGLFEEFGGARVRDTPISENGFVGAAAGAAMVGARPVVDITIASFVYPAMDQLISNIAKSTYLYGGQTHLPLVIRATMFYGGNQAAQHSDRPYPMFMGVPGLKIVAPSNPYDAKGLLKAAIRDDNPVLFFEDLNLWGLKAEIPDTDYTVPIGKAEIKRIGTDVTIVAFSGAVVTALGAGEVLAMNDVSTEIVDLRSLAPIDWDCVLNSVRKTGRLVIVDVAHRTCSAASEVAATVVEQVFWDLKAPIERVTTPDIHVPFSPSLVKQIFPTKEKVITAVNKTLLKRAARRTTDVHQETG